MNAKQLEGKWLQFRGRIQEHWGVLTDDDLDRIEGRRDRLIGILKERTGKTEEAIAKELDKLGLD